MHEHKHRRGKKMHRQTEAAQRREIYGTGKILHNTTLKQVYTLGMIEKNEDCSMRVDPYVFIVHLFIFKWKHEVQQQCYCFA